MHVTTQNEESSSLESQRKNTQIMEDFMRMSQDFDTMPLMIGNLE